jgi:tRNA dimethylallyltransferase
MESINKKILVICGPTATGKTSLGFKLAKKFDGEIISADSRQVYKYMDIGTGKERNSEIIVHGYDLINPNESFSVADYFSEMKIVIEDIWKRNKLPIIVGGTGLYIKSLVDGIPTIDIPKNENLRESLEKMSISEMFDKLAVLDSSKAASLNLSDKKNSRRLIRAIEVAVWNTENETQKQVVDLRKNVLDKNVSILMIGTSSTASNLLKNIEKRVEARMNNGFIDEVEMLLKMGISWRNQSMNSLGYKESEAFFKNGLSYEEFINLWVSNEVKYIKRQLTWFKKDKRINWFDIYDNKYLQNVAKLVDKWYSKNINAKES